jgi:flavin-dependent dehydrogenase
MAVSQEFAAMLSQALDAAARCAANETSDNYAVLGERLGELETLAKQSLQSNVLYQPIVTKLLNGTPLTAEELRTLRSLIVGDADYYLKYDDDFDRSKSELARILDQIRQLQSSDPDVSKLMHVGVL